MAKVSLFDLELNDSEECRPWLKLYPKEVPHHLEYPDIDVFTWISASAKKHASNIACTFFGRHFTYKVLFDMVDNVAASLAPIVPIGSRVALMMPNCPNYVIAFYALQKLGAIPVQMNPLNSADEIAFKMKDSGAIGFIAIDLLSQRLSKMLRENKDIQLEFICYTELNDYMPWPLRWLFPIKRFFDSKMPNSEIDKSDPRVKMLADLAEPPKNGKSVEEIVGDRSVKNSDTAVLMYSGGTTGTPKGIMLSHRALIDESLMAKAVAGYEETDVIVGILPIFHGYGMNIVMNTNLSNGGRMVLLPKFDAKQVMATIVNQKATVFSGVPTMFIAMKECAT